MRRFARWIAALTLVMIMSACSLDGTNADNLTPTLETLPTQAIQPDLDETPAELETGFEIVNARYADGVYWLTPGEGSELIWSGLPEDVEVNFVLTNGLADGGATSLGMTTTSADGIARMTFIAPPLLDGTVQGFATFRGAVDEVEESPALPVRTVDLEATGCQFLPAALGPGTQIYSLPDDTSDALGIADPDTSYAVTRVQGDWVEIQFGDLPGWVASGNGTLIGDCAG